VGVSSGEAEEAICVLTGRDDNHSIPTDYSRQCRHSRGKQRRCRRRCCQASESGRPSLACRQEREQLGKVSYTCGKSWWKCSFHWSNAGTGAIHCFKRVSKRMSFAPIPSLSFSSKGMERDNRRYKTSCFSSPS
jgi:hypothetical protein